MWVKFTAAVPPENRMRKSCVTCSSSDSPGLNDDREPVSIWKSKADSSSKLRGNWQPFLCVSLLERERGKKSGAYDNFAQQRLRSFYSCTNSHDELVPYSRSRRVNVARKGPYMTTLDISSCYSPRLNISPPTTMIYIIKCCELFPQSSFY